MRLFYIANVRMPTEKAYGVAIAKACEAFADAGVQATLVVPRRRNVLRKSIFETYSIKENFNVVSLPCVDLVGIAPGGLSFWLETFTFQISLFLYFLLNGRNAILYVREARFLSLKILGYKTVLESHHTQGEPAKYFAQARRANRIIVISQALKKSFEQAGFKSEEILVSPSGVDISQFMTDMTKGEARHKLGIQPDERVAVYTGHLYAWKGVDTLAHAAQLIPGIQFYVVGGTDSDVDAFKKKWHSKNLHVMGQRPHSEIPIWLKASDVLVLPNIVTEESISRYTSPLKLFEYMAASRPIVASDLPNIREILSEKNSHLIEPGNAQAIAKGVVWCLEYNEANLLAKEAYIDVVRYSWHARAKTVLAFLDSYAIIKKPL